MRGSIIGPLKKQPPGRAGACVAIFVARTHRERIAWNDLGRFWVEFMRCGAVKLFPNRPHLTSRNDTYLWEKYFPVNINSKNTNLLKNIC